MIQKYNILIEAYIVYFAAAGLAAVSAATGGIGCSVKKCKSRIPKGILLLKI